MKKKLTISLPVAILIGLLFVGVVGAAAWFVLSTTNVDITASSLSVDWNTPECEIWTGSGTIDSCTLSGSTMSVAVSGAKPDTEIQLRLKGNPNEENMEFYFHPPSPLPDAVSSLNCSQSDGTLMEAGTNLPIAVTFGLADISMGENVQFSYDFEARQIVP